MKQLMGSDTFPTKVGKLWLNLLSLETIARAIVSKGKRWEGPDLHELKAGDVIGENEFTDWETLRGNLNRVSQALGVEIPVEEIVEVRDLFAHGRAYAQIKESQINVIKFSKPESGKVKVISHEKLAEEFIDKKILLIRSAIVLIGSKNSLKSS